MKKILSTLAAVMALCTAVFAKGSDAQGAQSGSKALVAYFSATGTTDKAARTLADATGGVLYEIAPQQAYSSADLNWNDKQSRSSVEMNDPASRPALKETNADIASYDVVFIGYPIWWNEAPRIINTFIESHDLKGKKLVPFATSGGSGISNSVKELKNTYPDLNWEDGRLLNSAGGNAVKEWANEMMGK